jgi:hypothetical protein
VITDVVQVEADAGNRAVDLFFGGAFAEAHNGGSLLLRFRSPAVEKMADIVGAHDIRDLCQSGCVIMTACYIS